MDEQQWRARALLRYAQDAAGYRATNAASLAGELGVLSGEELAAFASRMQRAISPGIRRRGLDMTRCSDRRCILSLDICPN
jgi:hypothetical protein